MKIRFLLIALIGSTILLINQAPCREISADSHPQKQVKIQPANEPPSGIIAEELSPKIIVENDTHDFEDIDPGSEQKCQFEFSNQGQGELKIEKIQSTCGCTVPQLRKKTYLPGESGTINVTYRPGSRSGKVSKHLYILSNDKGNSRVPLIIKANVVRKIKYAPKRFKLRIDEENAGVKDITIKSLNDKTFAISKIQVRPECMKIDYDPVIEAKEFVLKPEVDMEKIKDQKNGVISIEITHPSQKKITIPFNVLPPFKSDPATLIALKASPDKPIRKTLYILSNYAEDFEITSVTPSNDAIKIIDQEHLDDKYQITLDIVPPSDIGDKRYFNSELTIDIDDGEQLVINCVGSISDKTTKKTSN